MFKRIFVEKKLGYDVEAKSLLKEIKESLKLDSLEDLRLLNRYDIEGIDEATYEIASKTIFSEPNVDTVYHEEIELIDGELAFGIEYLPGQYDIRGDWAAQAVQIINGGDRLKVIAAKIIVLRGSLSSEQLQSIKSYLINPVDSREAKLEKLTEIQKSAQLKSEVEIIEGFIAMNEEDLNKLKSRGEIALNMADIKFCQDYFASIKRNPTITELKVIDTYWSDHCRHTTFSTVIEDIQIETGKYSKLFNKAFGKYNEAREYVYDKARDITLMDLATIGMKQLRKMGRLDDLEISEEINACSIEIDVDVNGENEKWLLMFKNETHNHPTEIEPFGGAATCLGGAIRDPLSGRSYVYQAMRVTGSADPRKPIEETLAGKLPQKKITTEAAHGYSSYGNQIGLCTGQVAEIYHEDFVAKRMEVGAVIAAAPKKNVIRQEPSSGDVIILLGGKTGRDGCGGATGSSVEHTEDSILSCGAQVQKGDAPTERKIQRLFRDKRVSTLIKKCNDFGAGGVCVAIGELAAGLSINLDVVPKKYDGLDGTELAISESQERMAVVVAKEDADKFVAFANMENLEATHVATVTDEAKIKMYWNDKLILDLDREFLDTNGVTQRTKVKVESPHEEKAYFGKNLFKIFLKDTNMTHSWLENLKDLNVCSQKGLTERFDSSIGAGTALMPFGGMYQDTPTDGMVAKIPVLGAETTTGSIMTYGYNPYISKWSPFHGANFAVVESICKLAAMGGDYTKARLSFQEYFEKLGEDPTKWGKPFSALLGAYFAQHRLEIAAVGGKDSMSGSFKDINVPPTLISFAVSTVNIENVISPEFKRDDSRIVLLKTEICEMDVVEFDELKKNLDKLRNLIEAKKVLSCYAIKGGGISEAISKMSFGNKIGAKLNLREDYFYPYYGSFVIELSDSCDLNSELDGYNYEVLGSTICEEALYIGDEKIEMDAMLKAWMSPLEKIFPTKVDTPKEDINSLSYNTSYKKTSNIKIAKPRVFIPVFPGTNCEYDSARAFEKSGAIVKTSVFRNLDSQSISQSIEAMAKNIKESQIVMLPGGFSAGDEPDGSGKFIATIFRNEYIKEAVMELLNNRDGLMLGICNGFQALIKLGLLPYGEIRHINENDPTLTYNKIGRHMSRMVRTRVVSNKSPWLSNAQVGDMHIVPISHGEGRFVCRQSELEGLINNGQIATQYVDVNGDPSYDISVNPNTSTLAIEGICSPDGRVFGKMAHSERVGNNVAKNIYGNKEQKIFQAGVNYFR